MTVAQRKTATLGQRQAVLRLMREAEILVELSLAMQGAIHDLPLKQVSPAGRVALQNADALTQGLQCFRAALEGLAEQTDTGKDVQLGKMVQGVFLEAVRARLLGAATPAPDDPRWGRLDMF